jgi:alpha-glucosidase
MPRFSIHSWNSDGSTTEPWMFPDAMDTVRALFDLRETLRPVIAEALADYRDRYVPSVRPVFYDFPDDPDAWSDTDDFMLGRDLLVAPVVEPGAENRTVRLPLGSDWRDPRTGALHRGGTAVALPAPLGQPPYLQRLR